MGSRLSPRTWRVRPVAMNVRTASIRAPPPSAEQLAALSAAEQLAYQTQQAQSVQVPYIGLALALFALAVVVWLFRLPGEKLGGWPAHDDRVTAVAFDPTGEWLASGGRDRRVRLWRRTATGYGPYLTLTSPGAGAVRQSRSRP